MIYLDQTCSTPEANLALDESLLEKVERDEVAWLRFWRPTMPFVVLGRGNCAESEVNLAACKRDGISVLKRSSGGGAVVLGDGCLCYSVLLPLEFHPALATPKGTNQWILRRIGHAIEGLLTDSVVIQGDSDLTLSGCKFAGHAQRRKRAAILFHGSILLDFDIGLMDRYLRAPSRSPSYRKGRNHRDFVTNLKQPFEGVIHALLEEWGTVETATFVPDLLRG